MCVTIVINRGEKEIETPNDFLAHFGFEPTYYDKSNVVMTACLCQVDIETTLEDKKIEYMFDGDDYYVGKLEGTLTTPHGD